LQVSQQSQPFLARADSLLRVHGTKDAELGGGHSHGRSAQEAAAFVVDRSRHLENPGVPRETQTLAEMNVGYDSRRGNGVALAVDAKSRTRGARAWVPTLATARKSR